MMTMSVPMALPMIDKVPLPELWQRLRSGAPQGP
jgi:hypothetical protein